MYETSMYEISKMELFGEIIAHSNSFHVNKVDQKHHTRVRTGKKS